jgi:ribose 1,5-bisphosphokinase PhnN
MSSESGDGIAVKPQTLKKRLHERGLLKTTDAKRQRLTIRVTASDGRPDVLHLSAAAILSDSPSQPSQSSPEDEE